MSDALPHIGREKTLNEQVYEIVRNRLIEGKFEAGTFVRERELCEALGVSRTPVREALNRLASESFLERHPQRGYRVPEESIEALVDVLPVLHALEVLAGELTFPQLSEEDIEWLEKLNSDFEKAIQAGDATRAVACNDRFHQFLAERSGNAVVSGYLTDLRTRIHRLEVLDFTVALREEGARGDGKAKPAEDWVEQHKALIRAVREQDYEEAREVLSDNRSAYYVVFRNQLRRFMAEDDEPQPALAEES